MTVRKKGILRAQDREGGNSELVRTGSTLISASSRQVINFVAWIAMPPKGGGNGETRQTRSIVFELSCIVISFLKDREPEKN